jgi:multidrug efflux pump
MNISELSIRRPVLATVLTIIILLFGLIGYTTLGVREYPSVDNPIISVTCSYSGANTGRRMLSSDIFIRRTGIS